MKSSKMQVASVVMIVVAIIIIAGCSIYLVTSKQMIKKYDVSSFKVGKYDVSSFNSALKNKKTLIYAGEENGIITLKYDVKNVKLNDVYAYLSKLSKEGFTVVNLEDSYMRSVNEKKDIQVKINVTSNHLVFEYKIGIDATEETNKGKSDDLKIKSNKLDKEQTE